MPKLDRAALLFSINCFLAAALALLIGFAIDLPRPYWSVMTVYIVSQPLAGAVRAKAIYRVGGTLLGAAFAVLVVPPLVNQPLLLSLAFALWVGTCLGISLLDRTPRAYTLMLAGYTATLIGFPVVTHPEAVFDVAVSRVEEIILGILCATLTHSLIFPRPVGVVLQGRLASWLKTADEWALDLLGRGDPARLGADRRQLAVAATEIHLLSVLLPFDVSAIRSIRRVVRVAHEHFLFLVPLLSAIGDRIAAVRALPGGLDPATEEAVAAVGDWVAAGADPVTGRALASSLDARTAEPPAADWAALLSSSLVVRLADLVRELGDVHELLDQCREAPEPAPDARQPRHPRLHRDYMLAAISGFSAALSIMVVCTVWIETGWADGAAAAALAGVFCALFAALDDPAPAILVFGAASLVALVVAALYLFAVLPAIDGYPALVLCLAPTLLLAGYLMPGRKTALPALAFAIGVPSSLALQETYSADFADFANGNSALYVALFIALIITRATRSMSVEAAVHRLFRRNWAQLAELARGRKTRDIGVVAAEMVDRLGLIVSRLALGDETKLPVEDPVAALRISMNLAQIGAVQHELPPEEGGRIAFLLERVGCHFVCLSRGRPVPPQEDMLVPLDRCLGDSLAYPLPTDVKRNAVAALVGLRRNLLPDAPAYQAEALP